MVAQRPVGGKVAVELAREAALCEAARATALLSRTEPCRDASARRGFSRPGLASQACRPGCGVVTVIRPRDDVTPGIGGCLTDLVSPARGAAPLPPRGPARAWRRGAAGSGSRPWRVVAHRLPVPGQRGCGKGGSVQGRDAAFWPAGWPPSSALAGAVPVMRPLARKETAGGWLRQAAGPGEWPRSLRACGFPVAARPWYRLGHTGGPQTALVRRQPPERRGPG
jgi:hypothetical protein